MKIGEIKDLAKYFPVISELILEPFANNIM